MPLPCDLFGQKFVLVAPRGVGVAAASVSADLYKSVIIIIIKCLTLVKEALIEIGCVVTSLVVGWLVGCHARALWPNGAS